MQGERIEYNIDLIGVRAGAIGPIPEQRFNKKYRNLYSQTYSYGLPISKDFKVTNRQYEVKINWSDFKNNEWVINHASLSPSMTSVGPFSIVTNGDDRSFTLILLGPDIPADKRKKVAEAASTAEGNRLIGRASIPLFTMSGRLTLKNSSLTFPLADKWEKLNGLDKMQELQNSSTLNNLQVQLK